MKSVGSLFKIKKYRAKIRFYTMLQSVMGTDFSEKIQRYNVKIAALKKASLKARQRSAAADSPAEAGGACACLSSIPLYRSRFKKTKALFCGKPTSDFARAFLESVDYAAAEVHFFDTSENSLFRVKSSAEREFLDKRKITELDGSSYDMAVSLDGKYADLPRAFINFTCVGDCGLIDADFVNAANLCFDAAFVSAAEVADALRKGGLLKPVFIAPEFGGNNGDFFRQVVYPLDVLLGAENKITPDAVFTDGASLHAKYQLYLRNENKRVVVCPAQDGGFCSMFNKYLSHLVYSSANTVLVPDWRVGNLKIDILQRNNRTVFESFCYGTEADGNIFFRLFENPFPNDLTEDIFETDMMYSITDEVLDQFDFNEKNEPTLTSINSYNLYSDEIYFKEFRRKYNNALKKYIRLKRDIADKIEAFYNETLRGKFVVSALVRCQAHALELLADDVPSFEKYEKNLLRILGENNIAADSDNWRFFIATDNEDALAYFSSRYPDKVVSQKMNRLSHEQEEEYQKVRAALKKDCSGYELQHRAAADANLRSIDRAREILFDVYMLAKGDCCIFVNSNISTMASYINPEMEMVYCK